MRQRTEHVTQNVSGDEKRQSSSVRLAVSPGWSVVSAGVTVCDCAPSLDRLVAKGCAHSERRLVWRVALRGPFGAVRRASGRRKLARAAWRAIRAAAWRLSGGVGPLPDAACLTRSRYGTLGGSQRVVADCAGALYRLDALVSGASGARKAVRRVGLRASGPPRLSPDGTHWLCVVVRSSRETLRRLSTEDRPPTRAGGPRLPPLATRWAPASGTVTLQRRAKHYVDPDDWPQDDSAPQEADDATRGEWWGEALEE